MTSTNPNELEDECWLYAGYKNKDGYGQCLSERTTIHRAIYEAFNGAVPAGMDVDHICNVRPCINPDHLQLLSHRDNVRKGHKPDHCNRGHELTADNIYLNSYQTKTKGVGTMRRCKKCARAGQRIHQRVSGKRIPREVRTAMVDKQFGVNVESAQAIIDKYMEESK